jgi:hypothetical protein
MEESLLIVVQSIKRAIKSITTDGLDRLIMQLQHGVDMSSPYRLR